MHARTMIISLAGELEEDDTKFNKEEQTGSRGLLPSSPIPQRPLRSSGPLGVRSKARPSAVVATTLAVAASTAGVRAPARAETRHKVPTCPAKGSKR